jgi:regulator of sigma E protease
MELLTTGTNFLLILLGFGFLIFVHELGHFLAARWAGIRVENFSVGMGPPILSYRRGIGVRAGSTDPDTVRRFGRPAIQMSDAQLAAAGISETEYTLRVLPLGGYVRMLGQEDGRPASEVGLPRSYQTAPIGKRMVVVSAGVIMNLLTAIVLFLFAFAIGVRFPAPVVGGAIPEWPAATAVASNAEQAGLSSNDATGLQAGDRITAINGEPVATYADVMIAAAMIRPGASLDLSVERPGVEVPLQFTVTPKRDTIDGLFRLGDYPARSATITDVRESRVEVAERLEVAGFPELGPGATLLSIGGRSVGTFDEFEALVRSSGGEVLETMWSIPGRVDPLPLSMPPRAELGTVRTRAGDETILWDSLFGLTPLVRVDTIQPTSPNRDRLKPGDVILRIGDRDAPSFADLRTVARQIRDGALPIVVLRNGEELALEATVANGMLGFAPAPAMQVPITANPLLTRLVPSPAPEGGQAVDASAEPSFDEVPLPTATLDIFPGSRIVSVGGRETGDWGAIREALRSATQTAAAEKTGASVELGLVPPLDGAPTEVRTLALSADDVAALHRLGWAIPISPTIFDPKFVVLKADGPVAAVRMGFHETKKLVQQVYLTIDRVVRGSIGVDKLNGPVGIFHIGVKVADQGFMFLVFFVAMLSVNLAVINFLPLPIVDGGLFLFLVYEKIVGRPPSIAFQNAATLVGLVLIGSIFLITFYNDVARLVG